MQVKRFYSKGALVNQHSLVPQYISTIMKPSEPLLKAFLKDVDYLT